MDTSHCGKLTNTPWRPSDARVWIRARIHASRRVRAHAISMLKARVHVHARAPTRDKHERVYVGSLLRKRNEMKRPFQRAAAGPAVHPSLSRSFPPSIPFLVARVPACMCRRCRRANDDRLSDACVHTCASTHSGSPLMSGRAAPHVCVLRMHRVLYDVYR